MSSSEQKPGQVPEILTVCLIDPDERVVEIEADHDAKELTINTLMEWLVFAGEHGVEVLKKKLEQDLSDELPLAKNDAIKVMVSYYAMLIGTLLVDFHDFGVVVKGRILFAPFKIKNNLIYLVNHDSVTPDHLGHHLR